MIQFHWEQLTRRVREVVIYLCIAICSLSSSYPFSFVLGPMEHVRISSVADISFLLVPSCGNHVRQVRNLGVTYQWKMEMRDSNTRHRFLRVVHPCGCYYFKSFCFDPDSFLVAPRVCWKRASFHSNSRVPSTFCPKIPVVTIIVRSQFVFISRMCRNSTLLRCVMVRSCDVSRLLFILLFTQCWVCWEHVSVLNVMDVLYL